MTKEDAITLVNELSAEIGKVRVKVEGVDDD
jgi:hypothetical protein